MGYTRFELSLPTDYREEELRRRLAGLSGLDDFRYYIEKKSLDARKRERISWQLSVIIVSGGIPGEDPPAQETITVPRKKRDGRAVVVGTGPAGIFSALLLCEAGFGVTVVERGGRIGERKAALDAFESGGPFPGENNYAFGEGGAGAFSDGKLTSRSKRIKPERVYIHDALIAAGAPAEIAWLAHPHLGSDNLFTITEGLRTRVEALGGRFLFNTRFNGFRRLAGGGYGVLCAEAGELEADVLIVACGHGADDTTAALMGAGVPFRTKNFAMGFRVEHPQALINRAQWGTDALPGVKAAEYRLTAPGNVYTFCMCPGGRVIPAAAFPGRNSVNGMSLYARNGRFANAAVVAGLHPDELAGEEASPQQAVELVGELERRFFGYARGYGAPASRVSDLLSGREPKGPLPESSFPFPLLPADMRELFPGFLLERLAGGLENFRRKISGFETGTAMGLESRTSSSVQVLREDDGSVCGFPGLFIAGEASGWAGGIVSSAADGLKCALSIIFAEP